MRKSLKGRALLNFTLSKGKSAGRNSSGRITVFHRGGGSKRLQRKIDLKRSTSSIGIVERIEYDPNRSSRIALVRWIGGVLLRRRRKCNTNTIEERQIFKSTTATILCLFSFSSLSRKVDQRKVANCKFTLSVVVDRRTSTFMPPWSKSQACAGSKKKDVFFSALSSRILSENIILYSKEDKIRSLIPIRFFGLYRYIEYNDIFSFFSFLFDQKESKISILSDILYNIREYLRFARSRYSRIFYRIFASLALAKGDIRYLSNPQFPIGNCATPGGKVGTYRGIEHFVAQFTQFLNSLNSLRELSTSCLRTTNGRAKSLRDFGEFSTSCPTGFWGIEQARSAKSRKGFRGSARAIAVARARGSGSIPYRELRHEVLNSLRELRRYLYNPIGLYRYLISAAFLIFSTENMSDNLSFGSRAKPTFFAPQMREKLIGFSLCEIQKRRTHCAYRIKRQAALSWQSLRQQENLGRTVGAAEHNESKPKADQGSLPASKGPKNGACEVDRAPVTYILASHQLEAGQMVMNCNWSKPSQSSQGSKSGFLRPAQNAQNAHTHRRFQDLVRTANQDRVSGGSQRRFAKRTAASWPRPPAYRYEILDLNSQVGNCIPLADIRMGTLVHDIEYHPGQGARLARAAGTYAKIMKEPASQCSQCLVRLPSGVEKLIDSRCRATIGIVSNPHHGARKLRKAGQSRWLGRRPIVRGVAMNPVDHPHGGGEGRTKGGRPSVSPWGKPTKAGFRAVMGVGKHRI